MSCFYSSQGEYSCNVIEHFEPCNSNDSARNGYCYSDTKNPNSTSYTCPVNYSKYMGKCKNGTTYVNGSCPSDYYFDNNIGGTGNCINCTDPYVLDNTKKFCYNKNNSPYPVKTEPPKYRGGKPPPPS